MRNDDGKTQHILNNLQEQENIWKVGLSMKSALKKAQVVKEISDCDIYEFEFEDFTRESEA